MMLDRDRLLMVAHLRMEHGYSWKRLARILGRESLPPDNYLRQQIESIIERWSDD